MDRKRVGILIFPDVEVLDFRGPFEVFPVTWLNDERRREEPSPFEVIFRPPDLSGPSRASRGPTAGAETP